MYRLMMFFMMKTHDFRRDHRFQFIVIIGKGGEGVLGANTTTTTTTTTDTSARSHGHHLREEWRDRAAIRIEESDSEGRKPTATGEHLKSYLHKFTE